MKGLFGERIKKSSGQAFAIIGSVIGAGFITGREILTFFYGQSPLFVFAGMFALFFALIYAVLAVKNAMSAYAVAQGDKAVYVLNVLSVASMLGATESLARDMNFGCDFPIWSIVMLILSVMVCKKGMRGLGIFNAVLVPIMIGAVLIIFLAHSPEISVSGMRGGSFNLFSVMKYVGMNILLTQPLLGDIRRESVLPRSDLPDRRIFVLTAFIASLSLSVTAAVLLAVLPKESLFCEIPILYVTGRGRAFYYLVSVIVLFGIITTLVGSLYPLTSLADVLNESVKLSRGKGNISSKQNPTKGDFLSKSRGEAKSSRRGGVLFTIAVCVVSLAVSRLGFYAIVEKIYPISGVLAIVYYAFTFAVLPLFQTIERRRTLRRQGCTKARYRSLPDRV